MSRPEPNSSHTTQWEYRHDRLDPGADPDAPQWQRRADRSGLELLAPAQRMEDGSLRLEGYVAVPTVLIYLDRRTGRRWRELVTPEVLTASAAALEGQPITLEHPPALLTPETVDRYRVGTVTRSDADDEGRQRAGLLVHRSDAVAAVEAGKRELSAGYKALIDPRPGVHPTLGPYDSRQLQRRGNHVALVDVARSVGARVRVDSLELCDPSALEVPTAPQTSTPTPQETPVDLSFLLPVLSLLGISQRFDSEQAAADGLCRAIKARDDAHRASLSEAKGQLDAATAQVTTIQGRLDSAEQELEGFRSQAQAAADTEAQAKLLPLAQAMRLDGVTDTTPRLELEARIAGALLGRDLTAEERADAAYLAPLVEAAQRVHAERSDGRQRGRDAWESQPRSEGGAPQRPQAQTRQDSAPRLSLAERRAKAADERFNKSMGSSS